MEHTKYLEHAYNYSWSKRFWIRLCFCCFKRENEMLDFRMINKEWPEPEEATLPDNLLWQNMSFGAVNKFIRLVLIWLFSLGLLIGAFFAIYRLSTRQETTVEYKIVKECPNDVGKDEAYFDAQYPI